MKKLLLLAPVVCLMLLVIAPGNGPYPVVGTGGGGSGTTINITGNTNVVQIIQTNFTSGLVMSNGYGTAVMVSSCFTNTGASLSGVFGFDLIYGVDASSLTNLNQGSAYYDSIQTHNPTNWTQCLQATIQSGWIYSFTNRGTTISRLLPNSGQIVVLAAGSTVTVNNNGSATNVSGNTYSNVTLTGTSTIPNAATATVANGAINGLPGGNIVTNGFNFVQGGNPWHGDGQGLGASLTGQLWPAMSKPIKLIYCGMPNTNLYSQTNIQWIINDLATNTVNFTLFTNDGSQLGLYIDVGWDGLRNTNWSWITNNYGTLTCDSNRFPNGIEWVCKLAHTNNLKVYIQMLFGTNITPSSASTYIADAAGNSPVPFTNGTGTLPTNQFGHYVTVTTPEFSQTDMQELVKWGVDGVILAMTTVRPDYNQASYAWGRALLNTVVPNPANTGTYTSPIPNSHLYKKTTPVALIMYSDVNGPNGIAGVENVSLGNLISQNVTGAAYDNTAQNTGSATGAGGLRNINRDFAGTLKSSQGAYISWLFISDQYGMAAQAMSHGIAAYGYCNDSTWGVNYGSWVNFVTNSLWTLINQDASQNWPTLVDYGTNIGSVWYEKLSTGSGVAAVFAEGAGTFTPTIPWSYFGWDTNLQVKVSALIPLNVAGPVQTNSGGYSPAQTAGSYGVYKFDLVLGLQPGLGQVVLLPGIASSSANTYESEYVSMYDAVSPGFGAFMSGYAPSYPGVNGAAFGVKSGGNHFPFVLADASGNSVFQGTMTGNGSGLTNLTVTSVNHVCIGTNWLSGRMQTNTYGTLIHVSGGVVLTTAAVTGDAGIALLNNATPANGGATNYQALATTVGVTLSMTYTNYIALDVPTNAVFGFTNISTGSGNTSATIGGQLSY